MDSILQSQQYPLSRLPENIKARINLIRGLIHYKVLIAVRPQPSIGDPGQFPVVHP